MVQFRSQRITPEGEYVVGGPGPTESERENASNSGIPGEIERIRRYDAAVREQRHADAINSIGTGHSIGLQDGPFNLNTERSFRQGTNILRRDGNVINELGEIIIPASAVSRQVLSQDEQSRVLNGEEAQALFKIAEEEAGRRSGLINNTILGGKSLSELESSLRDRTSKEFNDRLQKAQDSAARFGLKARQEEFFKGTGNSDSFNNVRQTFGRELGNSLDEIRNKRTSAITDRVTGEFNLLDGLSKQVAGRLNLKNPLEGFDPRAIRLKDVAAPGLGEDFTNRLFQRFADEAFFNTQQRIDEMASNGLFDPGNEIFTDPLGNPETARFRVNPPAEFDLEDGGTVRIPLKGPGTSSSGITETLDEGARALAFKDLGKDFADVATNVAFGDPLANDLSQLRSKIAGGLSESAVRQTLDDTRQSLDLDFQNTFGKAGDDPLQLNEAFKNFIKKRSDALIRIQNRRFLPPGELNDFAGSIFGKKDKDEDEVSAVQKIRQQLAIA